MPDDHRPDGIERALEVAIYAPLGVGLWLKDLTPGLVQTFVSRGRAEVDRRHEQVGRRLRHARGMGEVAIAFGLPALRRRADARMADARKRVTDLFDQVVPGEGEPAPGEPPRVDLVVPVPPDALAPEVVAGLSVASAADRLSSADLPITGYDALSASQVVQRLDGLTPEELDAVRAYEDATRRRRTIIGKIDQLTS